MPAWLATHNRLVSYRQLAADTPPEIERLQIDGWRRGESGLDVGDRTRVELVGADVDRGFIDFARVR